MSFTPRESPGLENYGWDLFEGSRRFEEKAAGPGELVFPVWRVRTTTGLQRHRRLCLPRQARPARARPVHLRRLLHWHRVELPDLGRRGATGLRVEPFKISGGLSSFGENAAGELFAPRTRAARSTASRSRLSWRAVDARRRLPSAAYARAFSDSCNSCSSRATRMKPSWRSVVRFRRSSSSAIRSRRSRSASSWRSPTSCCSTGRILRRGSGGRHVFERPRRRHRARQAAVRGHLLRSRAPRCAASRRAARARRARAARGRR